MGQLVGDFDSKKGAVNLDLTSGPNYASPYTLHTVLYRRTKTEAINIIVEAAVGGKTLVIDKITGSGDTVYVFPNPRVPYPISLPNGAKLRFRTENVTDIDEDHSVMIGWADFS